MNGTFFFKTPLAAIALATLGGSIAPALAETTVEASAAQVSAVGASVLPRFEPSIPTDSFAAQFAEFDQPGWTLVGSGVTTCFANPGTSEMHFLAALENPGMRSVLCLFEGVATGAADGWYRMKQEPACTLLHLGPGLANGLANLHNARRASSGPRRTRGGCRWRSGGTPSLRSPLSAP